MADDDVEQIVDENAEFEPDPFEQPLPENWQELQKEHERLLADAETAHNDSINALGDMDEDQLAYIEHQASLPDDYTPQVDDTDPMPEEFMYITEDDLEFGEVKDQEPSPEVTA